MSKNSDDGSWLDPKWFVAGFAVTAFVMILTYDLRLGIAAGVLLAFGAGIWLYPVLRYGPRRGQTPTPRGALVEHYQRQTSNRRSAASREAQLDPQGGPDAP